MNFILTFSADPGEHEDTWTLVCPCQTSLPDLLIDRLTRASTNFSLLFLSWMDQRCQVLTALLPRMRSESVFLYICIFFFSPLSSVTIFSDITIILISNNLYLYLLKLLQINGCACVSITAELLRKASRYRRLNVNPLI